MKKQIFVLTMFPQMFEAFKEYGVLGKVFRGERAADFSLIPILISDYNRKGFKGVDDAPFGGGVGMIMRADSLESALIKGVLAPYNLTEDDLHVVCPSPRGKNWDNEYAKSFAKEKISNEKALVFICGRYEGIDERFLNQYVDEFISVGNFILTGGELATKVILDSSMRFVEEVLGNRASHEEESFNQNGLEHALYTRPREFNGEGIPEELLSGDPKKIEKFKQSSSSEMTRKYRPDLL